ncbi:MAG: hypothetical protein ACLRM8_02830 [Alistipes sp.]
MAAVDTANAWEDRSPGYFAFRPDWECSTKRTPLRGRGSSTPSTPCRTKSRRRSSRNLKSFRAMLSFELLLDKVVRAMAPGWELRDKTLAENRPHRAKPAPRRSRVGIRPVEELIRTYVSRTGSRGEMGILTSINQRLWNNYLLLKTTCKKTRIKITNRSTIIRHD